LNEKSQSLASRDPGPVICALVGITPDRVADMSRWASSILMSSRLDAGAHLAQPLPNSPGSGRCFVSTPSWCPRRWRRPSAGSPPLRGSRDSPLEDIEIAGHLVPAGSIVVLLSISANHDRTVLPGADVFDITRRTPDGWHLLTFGGGIHYCLGASLARLELVEALAELSDRLPLLRLDGEAVQHPPGSPIFGYQSLPIAWAWRSGSHDTIEASAGSAHSSTP
jgi:cytochrome P450